MFYKLKDSFFSYFLKCSEIKYLCLKNDCEKNGSFIVGNTYEIESELLISTIFDINDSIISNDILNVIIENTCTQQIFLDQINGELYAMNFINSAISDYKEKTPFIDIEEHNLALNNHIVDGRIITLWVGENIVATANIMRTPNYNRTHVVCHRISGNIKI